MPLQLDDGMVALVPDRFLIERRARDAFVAQNLGMHARDQHLLVIRSVEYADAPALRKIAGGAPEEVVLQFTWARMFETEHLAALRIDPGHHMLDHAILAGSVHGLEDQ